MKMDKEKLKRVDEVATAAVDVTGSTIGAIFKVIGTLLLIMIVTSLLFTCIFAYYVKTCIMPGVHIDLDDFALKQSSTLWYQDKNGTWQELITLSGEENRKWVDYEDLPKYLEKALVSVEDHRFYDHKGVDWYRTVAAFANMFLSMKNTFGGSTITQQLIKNVTQQDDITVQRKLLEIFQALEFEKDYSKKEIIEYYLNKVYFGEGCYGIQTAAETYFGKDAKDLTLAQAAAIVGITNLPTFYDPFYSVENNKERQELVLDLMYKYGYISKAECDAAKAEELVFVRGENEPYKPKIYSWYVEYVIDEVIQDLAEKKGISESTARDLLYNAGYNIYCCIDMDIQSKMDAVYQNTESLPQPYASNSKDPVQSAMVLIDHTNGEIKGMCGGIGVKDLNRGTNRATDSLRPPGSSIKPLAVYGPALEHGLISPSTYVLDADDKKIHLRASDGWYTKNASGSYAGVTTILMGLINSTNTISAQIIDKLTPETAYNFLQDRLNITSLVPDDANYPAMALGQPNYGISVLEMCQAYCALANDGIFNTAHSYSLIKDADGNIVLDNSPESHKAFSQNTARVMTYMLNCAATGGTGSESYIGSMPVAGKTGSSSSYRDRWFCGYTPYYTAAVWSGYDDNSVTYFSGNPSAQIWQRVMKAVHEELEIRSLNIAYGGGPTGIFGSKEELEDIWNDGKEGRKSDNPDPEDPPEGNPTDNTGGNTAA